MTLLGLLNLQFINLFAEAGNPISYLVLSFSICHTGLAQAACPTLGCAFAASQVPTQLLATIFHFPAGSQSAMHQKP